MAKKPSKEVRDVATNDKFRDVAKVEVTDALQVLAGRLGLDIASDITPDQRIDRAAFNLSRSAQYMLAAGVDLIALRAQVEHGRFLELIEERGFTKDAAYRAISYAQFLASRPEGEQERLLALPKFKVLELAKAEPEVLDVLMAEDGPVDLSATNVRELAAQVRELNKALTDTAVERDAAAAERDAALKRLAKAHRNDRADQVPVVVADLRAEIGVLLHGAKAAVESLHPIGIDLANLSGTAEAAAWIDPSAGIAFAGLVALHVAVKAQMQAWVEAFQIDTADVDAVVDPAFGFTDQELLDVAKKWDEATRFAAYEKTLRQWEREQERPRGKGRPTAKPEAPKGYTK